jgi:hypothetical protein
MLLCFICVVATLALVANVRAELGYVFIGDLNGDGVEDRIESGPGSMFGNAGGPFLVTLSDSTRPAQHFDVGLCLSMVAVERTPGGVRLWTYWHMSAGSGELIAIPLGYRRDAWPSGDTLEKSILIYTGEDGTELGNALLSTVFAPERTISFKRVENYTVPQRPGGREWGKP